MISNSNIAGYFSPSAFLPSFLILPVLLAGIICITMTDGGLSWWDASVIIFRFNSYRRRRAIMEIAADNLLQRDEKNKENPHRAYLTLVHLFRQKYDAGAVAREIIRETSPEMFNEADAEIVRTKIHMTTRRALFSIAIVFFAAFLYLAATLSLAFFNALVVSALPIYSTAVATLSDFFLIVPLVLVLLGILTAALEIPSFQSGE
jgi:hypothetical protein